MEEGRRGEINKSLGHLNRKGRRTDRTYKSRPLLFSEKRGQNQDKSRKKSSRRVACLRDRSKARNVEYRVPRVTGNKWLNRYPNWERSRRVAGLRIDRFLGARMSLDKGPRYRGLASSNDPESRQDLFLCSKSWMGRLKGSQLYSYKEKQGEKDQQGTTDGKLKMQVRTKCLRVINVDESRTVVFKIRD